MDFSLVDFMRVRASGDGAETISWWTGDVYGWRRDDGPHHLFGFEGLNVARAVRADDGWRLLSREAAAYLDPETRQVVDAWDNPFTGERVEVQHVFNDPVNQRLGDRPVPATRLGEQVAFNVDVRLAYPSPLRVADHPRHSAGDTYRAMELFQFFARAGDLDSEMPDVPCVFSWCRVSPWLPWMAMGQREGALVYHCRGAKTAEVPGRLREHVGEHFLHAPTAWSAPNMTSWTAFAARAAAS
ncbi:DUF1838 family protein [Nonomuraea cavernae]|uniref:DUF1838 domain-containing protein n=1 Tax=Nonomuraea cavernae TaxID=2045107 RepID=A0A917Z9H9_9ACTN|nr:DUF1838 family protein [Nonomuraea cavernae]MCA2189237.1 DUF1838 domain-containing protein [Nonomuraea cavernae]GGO76633.1 hypothetical protein GCM10012289_54420 [Nonomuraea cavernae]